MRACVLFDFYAYVFHLPSKLNLCTNRRERYIRGAVYFCGAVAAVVVFVAILVIVVAVAAVVVVADFADKMVVVVVLVAVAFGFYGLVDDDFSKVNIDRCKERSGKSGGGGRRATTGDRRLYGEWKMWRQCFINWPSTRSGGLIEWRPSQCTWIRTLSHRGLRGKLPEWLSKPHIFFFLFSNRRFDEKWK